MLIHTILRRTVAGTCALALTTVGFVALPGAANASPQCTPVEVASDSVDLGARTPGEVLCLDYTTPMDGFIALGATDTGRADGDQDVFANWSAPTSILVWTVPDPRNGVTPEIDIETNDAGTLVATYTWEDAPIDPGPSDPPVVTTPTPPTTISAVATDTTLALTWSGASGGDAGFDHYTVAWYLAGEEVDRTTTTAEGITLENLLVDTTYEVRVWTVDLAEFESADYASITEATGAVPDPDPSSSSPDPDPSPSDPGPLPATDPVADGPLAAVAGVESTYDVLANDPEGTTGAALALEPEHGTASFDEQGRLHYTPAADYTGEDLLKYTVAGSEATAAVTITVSAYVRLGAPTAFATTTVGGTSIAVSWAAPDGESSFPLASYRVTWWNIDHWVHEQATEGTTWTFTDLLPDTVYQFRVVAVDTRGTEGSTDAFLEPRTLDTTPVADEATAYTQGTWTIDVLANDPGSPASATLVTEPLHGNATWDGTKFQYTVTDSEATADFFTYRNDVSETTAMVSVTIAPVVAPSNPVITEETANGQTSITVSWNASVEGTFPFWRYIVTWMKPGVGWQYILTTETSVTIDELLPGTEYIVDVVGEDTWTNFSDSDRAWVTTESLPAPDAPLQLEAETAGRYAVDLTWSAAEPETVASYQIYYRIMGGDDPWSRGSDELGSATGSHVTGLGADATYQFQVLACDASEACSDPASTLGSTEVLRPSTPELSAEAAGTDSVDLSWTASDGGNGELDGYDVWYRTVGAEEWTFFDYLAPEDLAVTVDGLDAGTAYEFKVVAWDVDDYSSQDALATATTDDALPPAPLRPQITTSDAIVSGGTASFTVSEVSDSATVEAGDLVDGVSAVHVDGLDVELVTVAGFSGSISQPLLVSDGGDPVEITADVVVNPAAASRADYRIASATASRIRWTAGSGATSYVVKVGATVVCTTAGVTCLVPRLLGPASIVTITARGNDGTVAAAARGTWVSVPVNFGHVHFVGDSPVLAAASAKQLRTLASQLLTAGVTRLTVHGYTATLGTAKRTPVQLRLSGMRANAVAAYITAYYTAHGKTVRIVRVAEGATHPIASNATSAGRAENRRAEVVLG